MNQIESTVRWVASNGYIIRVDKITYFETLGAGVRCYLGTDHGYVDLPDVDYDSLLAQLMDGQL